MAPRERFHSGDSSLLYDVTGSGPPVILVHGLLGSHRWWAKNIPDLARSFRVYAIDLEGFGGNLTRRPFALSRAVDSLVHFMSEMDLESVRLIGHSMGGLISLELANRVETRIEQLILVDAAVLAFNPSLPRRMAGLVHAMRWTPWDLVPLLAADTFRAGPFNFVSAVRDLFTTDHLEELAQLSQPSLVIWGEYDKIVPLEIGIALTKALPNARLAVIEQAGHIPMWERAEEFNRIVSDFLIEGDPSVQRMTARKD